MSFLDNLKKKATDAVKKDPAKVKRGLDKTTSMIDKKTGGKYTDKLAKLDQKADAAIDKAAGRRPGDGHQNPPRH